MILQLHAPFWISLYMKKIWFSILSVQQTSETVESEERADEAMLKERKTGCNYIKRIFIYFRSPLGELDDCVLHPLNKKDRSSLQMNSECRVLTLVHSHLPLTWAIEASTTLCHTVHVDCLSDLKVGPKPTPHAHDNLGYTVEKTN